MAVGKLVFCSEHSLGWDSVDNERDLETAPESHVCLVYSAPDILLIPPTLVTIPLTFFFLTIIFPRKPNRHTGHEFKSHRSKYLRDFRLRQQNY